MGADRYTSRLIYGYIFENGWELFEQLPQLRELAAREIQAEGLDLELGEGQDPEDIVDFEYLFDTYRSIGYFPELLEELFNRLFGGLSLEYMYREIYSGVEPQAHHVLFFIGGSTEPQNPERLSEWIESIDQALDRSKIEQQLAKPQKRQVGSAIL